IWTISWIRWEATVPGVPIWCARSRKLVPSSPHKPAFGQRGVGGAGDDDVVVDGDAQQAAGLDELARNPEVVGAGLRIARWMVVQTDDAGRIVENGPLE